MDPVEPPLPQMTEEELRQMYPDTGSQPDLLPGEEPVFANDLYGDSASGDLPPEIASDVAAMEVPSTGMSFDFNSLNVQTREDFDALPAEQQELLKAMKRGVQFTPQSAAEFILNQTKMRMETEQKMRMQSADPVRQQQERKLRTEADIAEENRMKAMQKTFDTAGYMDDLLEKVKTHPGRQYSTGKSSILPKPPGTAAADFQVLLDQVQGAQFMQAYETLKGGGQITEIEGKKATDAMARMNPRQSEESFLQGVEEFQSIVRKAKERAAAKLPKTDSVSTPAATAAAPRPTKTISGIVWEKGDDGKWYRKR